MELLLSGDDSDDCRVCACVCVCVKGPDLGDSAGKDPFNRDAPPSQDARKHDDDVSLEWGPTPAAAARAPTSGPCRPFIITSTNMSFSSMLYHFLLQEKSFQLSSLYVLARTIPP